MPLSLALVFHFNQHTSEYAQVADRACYRGLLTVLRRHPSLKINLHLSGTLLRALNWLAPETLDLVRAGLADGQFELLGSTYAQNVPYVTDDGDNARQIALHREVLAALFEARPAAFWNPERCWRQSLVPVIADGGYAATLVEDHILRAAGLADPVPASTEHDGRSLVAVYDDNELRERFNFAVWFGRRAQLWKYLLRYAGRPGSERFLVAYAEDAEAMGLWGWELGYLPHSAWAGLDALLSDLEDPARFSLVHLSSVRAEQVLGPLPDGAARWMDRALQQPGLPFHEDGYGDWFDFAQRAPKLAHFRKLYSVMRNGLAAAEPAAAASPPAAVFHRQGVETYCHHQYEFGCIGVGGRRYWGWENVRTAFLYARVAQVAADPRPERWIEDVNGDGSDEQLLCDGHSLAVLTGHGGRLLYWFDLREGRQWVGNPLAVPPAPWDSGATEQPRLQSEPRLWLPDTFEPDLRPWRSLRLREVAPTRLGRRLSDDIFKGAPETLTVYRRRMRLPGRRWPLRAQTGALAETITVDDGAEARPDDLLDYRYEPDAICFLNHGHAALNIEKRVSLEGDSVLARYTFVNRSGAPRRLRLRCTHELAPDYRDVLRSGRQSLDFFTWDGAAPGVMNPLTRGAVVVEASRPWSRLDQAVNLLALELGLSFEFDLEPGGTEALDVRLRLRRV